MTDIDVAPPSFGQKIGAEALGTFVLVFFGVGAAMSLDKIGITGVALAFGVAVLVMAHAVGHLSGGHFNPAVSLGAAMAGRLSWAQAAVYAVVQVVSATVAALVLFVIYQGTQRAGGTGELEGWSAEGSMGQNFFGDQSPFDTQISVWAALVVEVVATAIFLYVILAATDKRNPSAAAAPAAIGLALTGIHLALIPLTGTSVNPARSIAPGLFAGTDAIIQLWLFILAPLVGAAIAGFTYALIFGADGEPVPGSGLHIGARTHATAFAGGWDPNAYPHQQGGFDPNAQQWGGQQQWDAQPAQPGFDPGTQPWGGQPPAGPQQDRGQPQAWEQQQWAGQQTWGQQQQAWEQPQTYPEGQPPAPDQPWGTPEDPEDGSRTQIRPNE